MYKYLGRWYPLTSNSRVVYFYDKGKCEDYARFLESSGDAHWDAWFCSFDTSPNCNIVNINGGRM